MSGLAEALVPVRAALLESAQQDAARVRAEAEQAAHRTLAAARKEAKRIRARARRQGAAEAASALAADRARARRLARATVLAARREGYEALHTAAREAVVRWREDPGYPRLHDALQVTARRALGRGVRLREAPDGGVVGERAGRRIDLSLTGFAARAVDACAPGLEQKP
jgi:vacuolar-type H+-ATPase subunit E/Vma4